MSNNECGTPCMGAKTFGCRWLLRFAIFTGHCVKPEGSMNNQSGLAVVHAVLCLLSFILFLD